jgi:hypothetical protein
MIATQRLKELAFDLRSQPPRSPRVTLGGYVLAARIVDKCRAGLLNQLGEYAYAGANSLDFTFFDFTGITPVELKAFVATGADDAAIAQWIGERTAGKSRADIVKWNNQMRDLRLSDVPIEVQVYMEDYIATHCPAHRPVYHYFDIYDLEEGRL